MAAAAEAPPPTDYVRIKRKKTMIFAYTEPLDTIHDLRAKVNHVTKVPTTDMKFFIDKDGEVPVDEVKSLADQKVRLGLHKFLRAPLMALVHGCCSGPTLPPFYLPASHADFVWESGLSRADSIYLPYPQSLALAHRFKMRMSFTWSSRRRARKNGRASILGRNRK